jgi:hypothetical protein
MQNGASICRVLVYGETEPLVVVNDIYIASAISKFCCGACSFATEKNKFEVVIVSVC